MDFSGLAPSLVCGLFLGSKNAVRYWGPPISALDPTERVTRKSGERHCLCNDISLLSPTDPGAGFFALKLQGTEVDSA